MNLNRKAINNGNDEWQTSKQMIDLFQVLLKRPGVFVSNSLIISEVWGLDGYISGVRDNYVWVGMSKLRKYLKGIDTELAYQLRNKRLAGYAWEGLVIPGEK